jgi:hypothetical protein
MGGVGMAESAEVQTDKRHCVSMCSSWGVIINMGPKETWPIPPGQAQGSSLWSPGPEDKTSQARPGRAKTRETKTFGEAGEMTSQSFVNR